MVRLRRRIHLESTAPLPQIAADYTSIRKQRIFDVGGGRDGGGGRGGAQSRTLKDETPYMIGGSSCHRQHPHHRKFNLNPAFWTRTLTVDGPEKRQQIQSNVPGRVGLSKSSTVSAALSLPRGS